MTATVIVTPVQAITNVTAQSQLTEARVNQSIVTVNVRPGQPVEAIIHQSGVILTVSNIGPQGIKGDKGDTGSIGPVGPSDLYIQNATPTNTPAEYLWIQTELGSGSDMTFWVEDGT